MQLGLLHSFQNSEGVSLNDLVVTHLLPHLGHLSSMFTCLPFLFCREILGCIEWNQKNTKYKYQRNSYTNEVLKRQNLASKYNDGILKLTPENIEDVAYGMIELYMNDGNQATMYDAKKRELKVLPQEVFEANVRRQREAKLRMLKAQGIDIQDPKVLAELEREEKVGFNPNPAKEQAESSVRRRLGFYDAVLGKNNPFRGEGIVP